LHEQVSIAYPSYHKFFCDIDRKTALYCWKHYPSPIYLRNKPVDELFEEFKAIASNTRKSKIEFIFECVHNDGDTIREYLESRDFITKSLARYLEQQKEEIALIDSEIEKMLRYFDYKLTTITGVSIATASKLIAEIGDIRRFPSADKLARYAGIAPIKFSSGGKGKEQSSKQQGNRELHGLFYFLAVSMVTVPKTGKPNQPVFYAYYQRKISEGAKARRNPRRWSASCDGW
jgi:transposase